MRNEKDVCHIAIPCKDITAAISFYSDKLGCSLAREKKDRATFNFFGDQLVCHLSPKHCPQKVNFYPYHYGITFSNEKDFNNLINKLRRSGVEILNEEIRFKEKPDAHKTFFIADPSNNVIEFKYYFDSRMKY